MLPVAIMPAGLATSRAALPLPSSSPCKVMAPTWTSPTPSPPLSPLLHCPSCPPLSASSGPTCMLAETCIRSQSSLVEGCGASPSAKTCVCVCVCARARACERAHKSALLCVCACVCVCVCLRACEHTHVHGVHACVHAFARERVLCTRMHTRQGSRAQSGCATSRGRIVPR